MHRHSSNGANSRLFETEYGYFDVRNDSYVIKRPDTPRPWVNVVANERYGTVISQAGGGFSWIDHSTLSVLTRWRQDLVRDDWGKWLYIRDDESGNLWSAAPQPVLSPYDSYECRHGLGYSVLSARIHGIQSEWTIVVPPDATFELWYLRLTNLDNKVRNLTACSHFMWNLGAAPDNHREFHRLFLHNDFDKQAGIIRANKVLWEVPTEKHGHWNTHYPYAAFHAVWNEAGEAPATLFACGDHESFTGRHGTWKAPRWLSEQGGRETTGFGRHGDAIAALASGVTLEPGETRELAFALGAVLEHEPDVQTALAPYRTQDSRHRVLESVRVFWHDRREGVQVETPDDAFNLLVNTWTPYQAMAGRVFGRTGYWQQSGAYGFRDQLQDSHVFLPCDPERMKSTLLLHAHHQFANGTVYHWWHPLSEVGLQTEMTDDLLWLAFMTTAYLKETGDWAVLAEEAPFVDCQKPAPLFEHCRLAITKVLERFSDRGLPLIGAGDWNDGMSACGLSWRGESVWLGHFLHAVLADWVRIARYENKESLAEEWEKRRAALQDALNTVGWDGAWYWRASLDDGSLLGSSRRREGRIFLNAQTWSVLAGVADDDRSALVMDAVEEYLLHDFGPSLFSPAYRSPDPRIGYLTRYTPGVRENGGVYSHAAMWAIQAACRVKRPQLAWKMFSRLAPPFRGMNPEHYCVEPYVMPGNVDGPDSPHYGRGGWSWYTGSAAWMRRISLEAILGVQPGWDGLKIEPCLPPHWPEARLHRRYRGDLLDITIRNPDLCGCGAVQIIVDGEELEPGRSITSSGSGQTRRIEVCVRATEATAVGAGSNEGKML